MSLVRKKGRDVALKGVLPRSRLTTSDHGREGAQAIACKLPRRLSRTVGRTRSLSRRRGFGRLHAFVLLVFAKRREVMLHLPRSPDNCRRSLRREHKNIAMFAFRRRLMSPSAAGAGDASGSESTLMSRFGYGGEEGKKCDMQISAGERVACSSVACLTVVCNAHALHRWEASCRARASRPSGSRWAVVAFNFFLLFLSAQ